jgi:hypothetical protein
MNSVPILLRFSPIDEFPTDDTRKAWSRVAAGAFCHPVSQHVASSP